MKIEFVKSVGLNIAGMVKDVPSRIAKMLIADCYAVKFYGETSSEKILPRPIEPIEVLQYPEKAKSNKSVTAYMATFPARFPVIKNSIASLAGQVDDLHVWCNDYNESLFNELRTEITNPNVHFYLPSQISPAINLGCLGKFVFCRNWKGYVLTVDDDFVYSSDYVSCLISKIDEYDRRAVISLHGRINQFPIVSYYSDKGTFFRCTKEVKNDCPAHIIGTGVMGFHTDALKKKPLSFNKIFTHTNISDISFSMEMQRRGVKTIVAAHEKGMVKSLPVRCSIGTGTKTNDKVETHLINNFNWTL